MSIRCFWKGDDRIARSESICRFSGLTTNNSGTNVLPESRSCGKTWESHRFAAVRFAGAFFLVTTVFSFRVFSAADILIGGFESGTAEGWSLSGMFSQNPMNAVKDLFFDQGGDGQAIFTGYQGEWLIVSRIPDEKWTRPGVGVGKAVSPEFTIERDYVKFRGGGMATLGGYYYLEIGGSEVPGLGRIYGNNNFDLVERGWDVRAHAGKKCRFVASISTKEVRAMLRFDHVVQSDIPVDPESVYKNQSLAGNGKIRIAVESPYIRPGVFRHCIPSDKFFGTAMVVYGLDNRWHAYGLQWTSEGHASASIKSIMHASSNNLLEGWSSPKAVYTVNKDVGNFISAPFIMVHEGKYWMFFGAGTNKTSTGDALPPFFLNAFTSSDGVQWSRQGTSHLLEVDSDFGRPWINRKGDQWIIYLDSRLKNTDHEIQPDDITTAWYSKDLLSWTGKKRLVFGTNAFNSNDETRPHPSQAFRHGKYWYLMGRTNYSRDGRSRHTHINVLRSTDQEKWDFVRNNAVNSWSSSQVVKDKDGSLYILTGGLVPTQYSDGIWIAPLKILDGESDADMSIPVPGGAVATNVPADFRLLAQSETSVRRIVLIHSGMPRPATHPFTINGRMMPSLPNGFAHVSGVIVQY